MFDAAVQRIGFLSDSTESDWTDRTVRLLLLRPDYVPSFEHHVHRCDVQAFEVEPSGGYQAGGAVVADRSIVRDEHGSPSFVGAAVTWEKFTGAFRWAVSYADRGCADEDVLLSVWDMGPQRGTRTTVTVEPSDGVYWRMRRLAGVDRQRFQAAALDAELAGLLA